MITNPTDIVPAATCEAMGVTIIYEDRPTGLRARHFAGKLIDALGAEDQHRLTCWRRELIDLPEIAEEMAADAVKSEIVIFSLRGNTSLSMSTKGWLESWLPKASPSASLVALLAPETSLAPHAEGVRCYLRDVAQQAGIAFFAHRVAQQESREPTFVENEFELAPPPRRFRRRSLTSPLRNTDPLPFPAINAA